MVDEEATNDEDKEVGVNITRRTDNDHDQIFSTLVLETCAVASENRCKTKRREVMAKNRRSKLIHATKREA